MTRYSDKLDEIMHHYIEQEAQTSVPPSQPAAPCDSGAPRPAGTSLALRPPPPVLQRPPFFQANASPSVQPREKLEPKVAVTLRGYDGRGRPKNERCLLPESIAKALTGSFPHSAEKSEQKAEVPNLITDDTGSWRLAYERGGRDYRAGMTECPFIDGGSTDFVGAWWAGFEAERARACVGPDDAEFGMSEQRKAIPLLIGGSGGGVDSWSGTIRGGSWGSSPVECWGAGGGGDTWGSLPPATGELERTWVEGLKTELDIPMTVTVVPDLRGMTGTDHVGRTAHLAAEEIERLESDLEVAKDRICGLELVRKNQADRIIELNDRLVVVQNAYSSLDRLLLISQERLAELEIMRDRQEKRIRDQDRVIAELVSELEMQGAAEPADFSTAAMTVRVTEGGFREIDPPCCTCPGPCIAPHQVRKPAAQWCNCSPGGHWVADCPQLAMADAEEPDYSLSAVDHGLVTKMAEALATPGKVAGHVFEGVGSSRRCVEPDCKAANGVFWDTLRAVTAAEIGQSGWSHDGLTLSQEEWKQFSDEIARQERIAAAMLGGVRS